MDANGTFEFSPVMTLKILISRCKILQKNLNEKEELNTTKQDQ